VKLVIVLVINRYVYYSCMFPWQRVIQKRLYISGISKCKHEFNIISVKYYYNWATFKAINVHWVSIQKPSLSRPLFVLMIISLVKTTVCIITFSCKVNLHFKLIMKHTI